MSIREVRSAMQTLRQASIDQILVQTGIERASIETALDFLIRKGLIKRVTDCVPASSCPRDCSCAFKDALSKGRSDTSESTQRVYYEYCRSLEGEINSLAT